MMYSVTEAHSVPTSLPHPLIGGNCMLKSLSSSSSPEEDVLAQKKKTNYFFFFCQYLPYTILLLRSQDSWTEVVP